VGQIRVGDSIDPFDKRAYAWASAGQTGALEKEVQLEAGQQQVYSVALAVADSPLAAYGILAGAPAQRGQVSGSLKDPSGAAALHAALMVQIGETSLPAYPDAAGRISFSLPAGQYRARVVDLGRDHQERPFTVAAARATDLAIELAPASAIRFDVRDQAGGPSPCKVQFLGVGGTPTPNLGTESRARGADHQYQSPDGQFTQQLPPGRYLVRITRGIEHDLVEREVEVPPGRVLDFPATLRRSVDTAGWISTTTTPTPPPAATTTPTPTIG